MNSEDAEAIAAQTATYRDELDEIAMGDAAENAADEAERKARTEPVRLIFKAAPGVHFVKIKPGSKAPIGHRWQERPLDEDQAIRWVAKGERLGIIPLSAGAGVLDLDSGGLDSLRFAVERIGEPVAKIETGSSTPDKPRYHLIYPAGGACGFGAWAGGEMRVESGQCVIYDLKSWAEAIGKINYRALPAVDFSKVAEAKTAKRARRASSRKTKDLPAVDPFEVPSEPVHGLRERTLSMLGAEARRATNRKDAAARMHAVRQWYVKCREVQVKAGWWKEGGVKAQIESDLEKWFEAFAAYYESAERERLEDESIADAIVGKYEAKTETATDDIAPEPDDELITLEAHKTNPSGAGEESLRKLDYRLRLNVFGPVAEVSKRGSEFVPLEDGADAAMWREVADRCVWEWTTGKAPPVVHRKHAKISGDDRTLVMRALLHRNRFDPVRAYLDSLPKWTPAIPSRLFTLMTDAGMSVNAVQRVDGRDGERIINLNGWAQSYLPLEIVRCTYHPGARRNPLPVLFGTRGGEGKSSLGEHILPPHLHKYRTSDYRLNMDEQKTAQYLLGNKVLELREFGVFRREDWKLIKGVIMEPEMLARLPYDKWQTRVSRHDVMYVSTNSADLPDDDSALHRRLPYIRVAGQASRGTDGLAWVQWLAEPLEDGHTRRDWLFAEAKWLIESSESPASFSLFPDETSPEQLMEFNRLQGGSFATAGTEAKNAIAGAIERLIEAGKETATLDDLRAAMVCAEFGLPFEDFESVASVHFDALEGIKRRNPKHSLLNGVQAFANEHGDRSPHYVWRQVESLEGRRVQRFVKRDQR